MNSKGHKVAEDVRLHAIVLWLPLYPQGHHHAQLKLNDVLPHAGQDGACQIANYIIVRANGYVLLCWDSGHVDVALCGRVIKMDMKSEMVQSAPSRLSRVHTVLVSPWSIKVP